MVNKFWSLASPFIPFGICSSVSFGSHSVVFWVSFPNSLSPAHLLMCVFSLSPVPWGKEDCSIPGLPRTYPTRGHVWLHEPFKPQAQDEKLFYCTVFRNGKKNNMPLLLKWHNCCCYLPDIISVHGAVQRGGGGKGITRTCPYSKVSNAAQGSNQGRGKNGRQE